MKPASTRFERLDTSWGGVNYNFYNQFIHQEYVDGVKKLQLI